MALFDNLSKKIGSMAESAADKAKELAEIAKLNSIISSEQRIIEAQYIEIGKFYFETEKDNPASPVTELCMKIVAAQNNIAEYTQRLEQTKAGEAQPTTTYQTVTKFCANCGAAIPENSKFCQACGTPSNN